MLQLPVSRAAFLKLPLIQWMPRRGSQAIFYCEAQDLWLLGTWERVNHKTSLTIEVTQDETAWLAENPAWQRQGAPVTLFERAEFGEKLLLPDMSFAVPDEAISVREGTTSKELAPVSITLEEFQELSLHFVGRDVLGTAYVTTGTGVNMTAMWSKDRSHLTLSATSDSHDDWWGYDWPDTTWGFRSSLRDLQESYPVNVTITGVAFNAADLVARNQKRIEIAKRYDGLLPINAFVDVLMTHPTLSEEECLSLAMPVPVTTLHWGENEHSVSRFEILADVWKMYGTISEKQWAAYEARTRLPR
ncbi:MAG: hypothetical protein K2X45_13415, partial [Phreatobacter sp.]|nr:hypothetical protein [Phreatobacter sp.]